MSAVFFLLRVAVTLIMVGAGLAVAIGCLALASVLVAWFVQGLTEIWK